MDSPTERARCETCDRPIHIGAATGCAQDCCHVMQRGTNDHRGREVDWRERARKAEAERDRWQLRAVDAEIKAGDSEHDMNEALAENVSLRRERDAARAEAKRLREVLEYQIEMWESVPPGPDYDAREDDCSPEDMVAWQAGVAIRAGKAALAAPSDPPKEAPRE